MRGLAKRRMVARTAPGWVAAVALLSLLAAASASAQAAPEPSPRRAATTGARLAEAVAAYTRGLETPERDARLESFRRAERLFRAVAADGVRNAALQVNLGNAALQAERLGAAVLAYRRALRIDPDHPQALQNLEHARSLLPEWVPRPEAAGLLDSFFFWHRTLARSTRSVAAAACFAGAALLLAGAVRWRQPVLRNAAWLPALAWLALLGSVWLDPEARARDEAVVVVAEAVARAADSALAPGAFPRPLPGGSEVQILERRSPWLRIRLANGRDAWVTESSVERVASDDAWDA